MTETVGRRRLLLIGWDAADWPTLDPLLQAGFLPNLARLVRKGAAGSLQTVYPVTAPVVWTSAVTGVCAEVHGIFGYADASDDGSPTHLVGPADRLAPAIHDLIVQRGGRSHVINWPCSFPAYETGGLYASDTVTRGLAVPDLDDSPLAPGALHEFEGLSVEDLAAFRMASGEIEPSILARFLSGPGAVPTWLGTALAACFTVHNYATAALESGDDWDFCAIRYPGPMPLAVARARGGSDSSQDHAALEGLYRLHDQFLGRLLQIMENGPDTAVMMLSAHGFPARLIGDETDIRPGMLVLSGVGIAANTRLTGASLLDIAPTALTVLGFGPEVASASGMTGKVLRSALIEAEPRAYAAFADAVRTSEPAAIPAAWRMAAIAPEAGEAMLASAAQEGLLPQAFMNGEPGRRGVRFHRRWTYARALAFAGRSAEAISQLRELHREMPERDDVSLMLADELVRAGLVAEADATVSPLMATSSFRSPDTVAQAHLTLASAKKVLGKRVEVLGHLAQAAEIVTSPLLLVRLGHEYYRLGQIETAATNFNCATAADPTEPLAWLGRAGMAILMRQYELAVECAQRAVALRHDIALAHIIMARSLRFLNRKSEARAAYAEGLRLGIHDRKRAGAGEFTSAIEDGWVA